MNKRLYYRSVMYVIMMVIFGVIAYLFLDNGFNGKTKNYVSYDKSSDIYIDVSYLDDEYDDLDNNRYIASYVDKININYVYDKLISDYVSGYYRYNVYGYLIIYEDDKDNVLLRKEELLVKDKTLLIDDDTNDIKIDGVLEIDYQKYRKMVDDFSEGIDGDLHIRVNIMEGINFNSLNKQYDDISTIEIDIPLTDDIFKISVDKIDEVKSYYEFSEGTGMNILFLVIGSFSLAFSVTLFIMIVRQFKYLYKRQGEFRKRVKKILDKYDRYIVKVNRLYVKKKYNMIDVDNFLDLVDVSDRTGEMISFKEVNRGIEAIFLIIEGDNAWIYRILGEEKI